MILVHLNMLFLFCGLVNRQEVFVISVFGVLGQKPSTVTGLWLSSRAAINTAGCAGVLASQCNFWSALARTVLSLGEYLTCFRVAALVPRAYKRCLWLL